MSPVVTTIVSALASSLATILVKGLSAVSEVVKYLHLCKQEKREEKEKKETQEHNAHVKDVCDNGNVEDLLNL